MTDAQCPPDPARDPARSVTANGLRPATSTEADLIHFLAQMVHDMGYRVTLIRALAADLAHGAGSRSPRLMRTTAQIAKAADDLANGLKLMRFFGSDEEPASCDFLDAILQPVVSFVSISNRVRSPLRVGPTTRAAPRVQVRAGPARRALVNLLGGIRLSILCDAEVQTDSVVFHLTLHGRDFELDGAELAAVVRSLQYAEVVCKTERHLRDRALRIALCLKRSTP